MKLTPHPAENVRVTDFDYTLPEERIAQNPLETRDSSKLLVYRDGFLTDEHFHDIGQFLPENSLLVFNDTRVIHARLLFPKSTGAVIEIFCLEPLLPETDLQKAFTITGQTVWKCLIGNLKRWRKDRLAMPVRFGETEAMLYAEKKTNIGDGCFAVEFSWEPSELDFSVMLEQAGHVPLPPYIKRASTIADQDRYQTIFAHEQGSVAAPTAGLHFTDQLIKSLEKKGIRQEQVTLHVGLGTFRPVSAPTLSDHIMHEEKISVSSRLIRTLLQHTGQPVIAVGTTAVRTLESLYWTGLRLILDPGTNPFEVGQWAPYSPDAASEVSTRDALSALLTFMNQFGEDGWSGITRLMIIPGYRFRVVTGLITNFHMPQSTLLMLVSAFIGPEWKKIYNHALENDYRFLSYGDACLFFPTTGQI